MLHTRIARTAMLLSLLAAPGIAMQRPAPAPTTPPAQDQAQREERARQEAEREAKAKEQREQAERERTKKARERAKDNEAVPEPAAAPNPAMRETARNLYALERVHRERLARIERLMQLFREKGDQDKLLQLEQLRAKENKRYDRFLERYKAEMGPAYDQVAGTLNSGKARKQSAPGDPNRTDPPRARENKPNENNPNGKQGGGQ